MNPVVMSQPFFKQTELWQVSSLCVTYLNEQKDTLTLVAGYYSTACHKITIRDIEMTIY